MAAPGRAQTPAQAAVNRYLLESVTDLCVSAAREQFAGLQAHEATQLSADGVTGGTHFDHVRHYYAGAVALLRQLNPTELAPAQREVASRAMSQIAWFALETHSEPQLQIAPETYVAESLAMDPRNVVALYAQGLIAQSLHRPGADQLLEANCRKAVAIDPTFAEGWLELRMAMLRSGHGNDPESTKAYQQFLTHVGDSRPELGFFDDAYPYGKVHIMGPDGKEMKRVPYASAASRFTAALKPRSAVPSQHTN